jgi:hypothetical protein
MCNSSYNNPFTITKSRLNRIKYIKATNNILYTDHKLLMSFGAKSETETEIHEFLAG